jgi:hypothetical protein
MMIGDKMLASAIHQQRDTPERYAMIVFEDQIFGRQYLRGFRKTLDEKLKEILDGNGHLPSPEREQRLPGSKLADIIDFLNESIQPNSNEPTPQDNIKKYIAHCLEKSMRIALRTWNSQENQDFTFVVTTLSTLEGGKSRFCWKNGSTLNQDSSNEFLVFWCMDTDGLQLDMKHLNKAQSLNVKPLCPFFETGVKKALRFHLPQNTVQRRLLKKSATTNGLMGSGQFLTTMGDYEGTDHFFLLLSPNAEALQYRLTEDSVSHLSKKLSCDYPDAPKGPKHGTQLFLHMSLLSSKPGLSPSSKAIFRDPPAVIKRVASEMNIAVTWDDGNIESVHAYIRSVQDSWKVSDLTSAGLYVNKGETRPKKKIFPIPRLPIAPQIKIEEMVSVFKWSTTLSPLNGKDKKNRTVVSAWTDDLHRCNGKTKIAMFNGNPLENQGDSDRAARHRELLLRYGENCYGGFQPCQRIVKNKLRCADHT